MVTPLLLVLSTFLMAIALFNFCNLNLCFATICLFMNIPVALLSKSAFIITPLCISIFSTPIFNHTSLNILKVLLTFFWLSLSFPALSSSSNHGLPYCVSQTSFSHISTNSLTILTVSMATESPWEDLSIDISHASNWSVLAKILGRSTGNYYGTIY